MFPDEAMVEHALAHVLNCRDNVDKAREASKMFAALNQEGTVQHGLPVAKVLHCHRNLLQSAASVHAALLQLHLGLGRH